MKYTENNTAIIDGNRTIPCDDANLDYRLIKYGNAALNISPTLDDVEAYEPPIIDPQVQISADAHDYLTSTDWYVVRLAETSVAIPEDIRNARQIAREGII